MDIRIGNDIRLRFYFDSSKVNINEGNIISAECKIVKSTDYEKFMSLSNNCVLSEYEFHTCGRPTYNVMPHYFHRNCGIFTFDGVCDHEHKFFWHHPFFHKHCYSTKQFTAQSYENVTVVDVIYPGKCQDCIGPYKVMLQLVTADSEWNISGMHTYLFDYNPIDFRLVGNGGKCGSITIFFGSADAKREIISSTPWEIENSFVKPAETTDYKKKTIELSGAVTRSVVYSYSDGRPNSEETETAGIYWKVSTDGISYNSVGANYTIPEYNEDLNENRIFYFKGYITDKEGNTINIEDANFNITQSVKPHIKLNQSEVYINFNGKTDIIPISIYGNVNLDDINIVPSIGSITISKQDGVYYYTISEYNGDSTRTGIISIKYKDDPVYSFTINQYGKNIVIKNFAINRTTSKYIDAEPSGDRLSMRSNLELHYSYDKYSILFDGTEELIETVYDNGATISGRVKVNNYGIIRSEENTGNIYWPVNYDIEPRSVDVVITATIGELEDTITLTSTQKASEVEYTEFWDKPIVTRFEYFTLTYNGGAVLPYEIEARQNKIRRYSDGREDEIIQTITREDHVLSFELAFSGDPNSEYYDNVDPNNGKVTFPGTNYGPNDVNIKAILVVTANGVASDPVEAIATQLANPNPEPEETFEYIWQTPTVVKFEYEDVDYNVTDSYPTLVITQNLIKRYSSSKPDEIVNTITYSDNSDQFNLMFGGANVNNSGKVTFPGPNNGTEPHTTTVTLTVIANNKTSIQYTAIATLKVNPSANTPTGYYGFMSTLDIINNGISKSNTPYAIYGQSYNTTVGQATLLQNLGKRLVVITTDIMLPQVELSTSLGNTTDVLDKLNDILVDGTTYSACYHSGEIGTTWTKMVITPSDVFWGEEDDNTDVTTLSAPTINISKDGDSWNAVINTDIENATLYTSINEQTYTEINTDRLKTYNNLLIGDTIKAYVAKDGKQSNEVSKIVSPLSGKVILGLGDSYLENEHLSPEDTWLAKVCRECGATYIYTCTSDGEGWSTTDTAIGGNCLLTTYSSVSDDKYYHKDGVTYLNPTSGYQTMQLKDNLHCFKKGDTGGINLAGTGVSVIERLDLFEDSTFQQLTGKSMSEVDYVVLVGGRNDYTHQEKGSWYTSEILQINNTTKQVRVGHGRLGYEPASTAKTVVKKGTIIRTVTDKQTLTNNKYKIIQADLTRKDVGEDGSWESYRTYLKEEYEESAKILADKIKTLFPNAIYCFSTAWATVTNDSTNQFNDGSFGYYIGERNIDRPLCQYELSQCIVRGLKDRGFYILDHSTADNQEYRTILNGNTTLESKITRIKNYADSIVFTEGETDSEYGSPVVMYYPAFRTEYEQDGSISHLNDSGHELLVTYAKNFLESLIKK